jgi:hypothetical protein
MTLFWELPAPKVVSNVSLRLWTKPSAKDVSYQILHAKYLLERLLQKFVTRSANFDIVFFQGTCFLYLMWRDAFNIPSCSHPPLDPENR